MDTDKIKNKKNRDEKDKHKKALAKERRSDPRLVRFDWAIKYLLRSPVNFDVLESLLSAVLNDKIKIEEILESEGNKKAEDEKFDRVDIKCKNSLGDIVIIEVQNTREADYMHRILFGVSQTVMRHIDEGHPYNTIPKIYSISIVYFKLGAGDDYAYHGQYEFNGIHTHRQLQFTEKDRQAFGISSPNEFMPETYFLMVADFDKVAKTPLDEWMRFLKDGVIDPNTKDAGLRAAREKLNFMRLTRDEQDRYMRYYCDAASFAYTQKVERKIARDEGIQMGIAQVAKRMKASGRPIEEIIEFTGLSRAQIEEL